MMTFLEYLNRIEAEPTGRTTNIVDVHTNPSKSEFETLIGRTKYGVVRGTADEKGNVHVWDADVAIHGFVNKALGMGEEEGNDFYATKRGIITRDGYHPDIEKDAPGYNAATQKLLDHPKIKRIYGGNSSYDHAVTSTTTVDWWPGNVGRRARTLNRLKNK